MGFESFRGSVSLASIAILSTSVALAQSGQADIKGIVTDPTGSAVPGAEVTLTNVESGTARAVTSASDGKYSFPTIAPGRYTIAVSARGFSRQTVTGLVVLLDAHLDQDVKLALGTDQQTIEVSGTAAAVDLTSNDVGGVITQAQIETLPIPNRQYLNLALLTPGTTQDASRTFYSSVQAGGGLYYYSNGFYLDGVTNQQTEQGDPRQNIPEGAVAQFKTYTASFPAELGWAMGGFTTVVTKSGTNTLHGEAFEYFRNSFLNADNFLQQQAELKQGTGKAPYNRNQFGGDAGGAIFKDRTHYYGAYEGTVQTTSYTLTGNQALYGSVLGTFKAPGHDHLLTLRLDHNLTEKQQLFARYAQEWNLVSANGCGGATTIGCYDGQIPRHAIVVGHTWEPNARLVNEARFQYAYISYELGPYNTPIPKKPLDLLDPNYTKNVGVAYQFPSFGYGHNYSAVGVETRWQVNDSVTIQRGAHSFKLGFDTSYVPYVDASAVNLNGTYTFKTDQVFDPNNTANLQNATSFTQAAVPLVYYLPSTQLSFFGEDSWKAASNLTVNLGVRWDRQYGAAFLDTYKPDTLNHPVIPGEGDPRTRGDRNNFGPRIGFSYDPLKAGKDVIRGGWGVYYNFIQTEQQEAEKLNFVACPITISNGGANIGYPNPYGGQTVSSFCTKSTPNVTVLSPDLANPYQHQFSLGYSRQLSNSLSVSADGIYNHGLRDYRNFDLNYPVNYPTNKIRPDTQLNQIVQHAPVAQTEYKALYIKFDKRFSNRYMYTASYALASGLDNNPHGTLTNYTNPKLDYGPSSIDRRHAVVLSGSVLLPGKVLFGGIFTYRSALPFSVTTSGIQNANGAAQFVPGTSRNQGNRGISYDAINAYRTTINLAPVSAASISSTRYLNLDVRVSKYLFQRDQRKIELIGQTFNLFGFRNYTSFTSAGNSGTFGVATNQGNAQLAELAARFTF